MNSKFPRNMSISQQIDLFSQRGILFPPKGSQSYKKDAHTVQEIGYYKLKEFSYPFANNINGILHYKGLSFSKLLQRYHLDKHLRMAILSLIEELEVSLNSNISDILGKNKNPYRAAFGYLNVHSWADNNIPKGKILKEQNYIKNYIKSTLKKHILFKDIRDPRNLNNDGYPSVWLFANILTFGITVYIIKYMSKNKKKKLAIRYSCLPNELMSWTKCLKFVRNICAHNDNFIDLKIVTRSKKPRLFGKYIMHYNSGYSDAIATPIFDLKYLMLSIDSSCSFENVVMILRQLIHNDDEAKEFGFISLKALNYLLINKAEYNNIAKINKIPMIK